MEYTRLIGDYHETFEGTPEEVIKLVKALDQKAKPVNCSLPGVHSKVPNVKIPNIPPAKLSPHILFAAEMTRSLCQENINERALKGGEQ